MNLMLGLEAELSSASEQLADLERNAGWYSAFNVRLAFVAIARCMDEAAALREEMARVSGECEALAERAAPLQVAVGSGLAPLRRWSSRFAAEREALEDAQAALARLQAHLDALALQLKAVHGDIARVEAELERYRAFDFPGSVRRRMKLEDRVAMLRGELAALQRRTLSLASA